MLDIVWARFQQGQRTMKYPDGPPPELPHRFAGRPTLDSSRCPRECSTCMEACPTDAITAQENSTRVQIDLGRCIFCRACERQCPGGVVQFTRDYHLAATRREDLVIGDLQQPITIECSQQIRRLFGRSLKLRQVSAGGCNACEADTNVLGTVAWDLGRFGIQFVASPRHADGLLITGPVTANMRLALEKTYAAVPPPRMVIAVGACAISGGPYIDHPEVHNGAPAVLPVDLFVPGCPPHPLTILDALLRFLGKDFAARKAR